MDRNNPVKVAISDGYLWVTLADERIIGTPLAVLPWLAQATPEQQQDYQLIDQAILWDSLDEGLDTEEMLRGYGSPKTVANAPQKIS